MNMISLPCTTIFMMRKTLGRKDKPTLFMLNDGFAATDEDMR